MIRMQGRGRLRVVIVEHAEPAREGNLLLGRQLLLREDEHDVLQPGLVDFLMLRIGQGLAEVDATDLGAGCKAQWGDFERAHVITPRSNLSSPPIIGQYIVYCQTRIGITRPWTPLLPRSPRLSKHRSAGS